MNCPRVTLDSDDNNKEQQLLGDSEQNIVIWQWRQLLIVHSYDDPFLLPKACLHGGGGPQVGEVTRLDGVTRLSI